MFRMTERFPNLSVVMAAAAQCSTSGGCLSCPDESGKGNGRVCESWTVAGTYDTILEELKVTVAVQMS